MTRPFMESPLGGNLGVRTASFYRLNAVGVPVQLISDLDPSPSNDRVRLDMIDSESAPKVYTVTSNAMQDLSNASSNVHKELNRIDVTGTLISSLNLGLIGSVGVGNLPGLSSPFRPDLMALVALIAMADRREPIAYFSPRNSMPLALIESISPPWDPSLGENTIVSISLVEARIVNPLTATDQVLDVANSLTGNNASTPAGSQSGRAVETQAVTQSSTPGVAPTVVGAP
jgi:hypothetical protein